MKTRKIVFYSCLAVLTCLCSRGIGQDDFRRTMELVGDHSIRGELDLTREQLIQLRSLEQKLEQDLHQSMESQVGPADRSVTKIRELKREAFASFQSSVDQILLPVQKQRLSQIALQDQSESSGLIGALTNHEISRQLDIDPDLQKQLTQRSEQIQKKLAEDIAALKKKADEDLLGELTSEQRSAFERLLGERFVRKPRNERNAEDE